MPADSSDEVARLLALLVKLHVGNQADTIVEMSRAGLSPTRIAQLLGTTAGTVNVALNRAKTRGQR